MANCAPKGLLETGVEFLALTPHQLGAVRAVLLCQILQNIDPMATCDVSDLLASGACFNCLDARQLEIVQAQLLCEIAHVQSGQSNSGVDSGPNDPADDPLVESKVYYNTTTKTFWIWNDPAGSWYPLLA
jgi:hypothetical protein